MSLTVRIAGGLVAVVLAALVVPGFLLVVGVEDRTRELEALELDELAAALERRQDEAVAQVVDGVARAARELSADVALMRRVLADGEGAASVGRSLMARSALDLLWILRDDGVIASAGHWPARAGARRDDLSTRVTGTPFVTRVRVRNESWPALLLVEPIPSGEQRLLLVGGARLDVQAAQWSTGGAFAFALVDGEGDWLGARPARFPLTSWPRSLPPGEETTRRPLRVAGEDWLVAARRFSTDDDESGDAIGLVAVRSLASLRGWHRRLMASLGMVAVLAAGIAALTGLVLARRLGRPIRELTAMTTRMAGGDLNGRLPVRSSDEVGRLARSFNSMADALRDGRRELARSERLAAWRDAARRMAHEVKNPLAPIRMSVENLQRARSSKPEAFERFFEEECSTILEEVDALRRLVDEFSRFARLPEPRLRAVAPEDLVRHVADLYRPALDGVELEVRMDEGLPLLSADPDLLGQVLKNLLGNALQALHDAPAPGGRVVLQCTRRDDAVVLSVRDNGPGIPASIRDRLFEPRVTTKKTGSGLGLAVSRQIAEKHGGRIDVATGDEGTTFEIVLPVAPGE